MNNNAAPHLNKELFYQAYNGVSKNILYAIPSFLLFTYIFTALYSFLLLINPFTLLNPFLFTFFILAVAALNESTLKKSKIQGSFPTKILGVLTSIITLTFTWLTFLHFWIITEYPEIHIFDDELLTINPSIISGYLETLATNGWNTIFGMKIDGIVMYCFWIIEAAFILFAPYYSIVERSKLSVFCRQCHDWATEKKSVLTFTYLDEEKLKEKFINQDLSFLDESHKHKREDSEYYVIDLEWCNKCNELFTASLRKVKATGKRFDGSIIYDTDTLFEDLLISRETFLMLKKNKKNFKTLHKH